MQLALKMTLACILAIVTGIWDLTLSQERVQHPVGRCITRDVEEFNGTQLEQRGYRIPGTWHYVPGTLCAQYARYGWEEPMVLYLGEGAEDYRELIERAIEVWNETVDLGKDTPLIEITDKRPETYRLASSFWEDTDEEGKANLDDNQSVIYFTTSEESDLWGLAWRQWSYRDAKMLEADIYINTFAEEEHPDEVLVLNKKLSDIDSSYAAYATFNKTYAVILHELGHAIGLNHVPTSGNVMSRDFGAGGIDQWAAPIAVQLFNDSSPRNHPFVERKNNVDTYMALSKEHDDTMEIVDFFTNNAKLGEQEKMALTCIYPY